MAARTAAYQATKKKTATFRANKPGTCDTACKATRAKIDKDRKTRHIANSTDIKTRHNANDKKLKTAHDSTTKKLVKSHDAHTKKLVASA